MSEICVVRPPGPPPIVRGREYAPGEWLCDIIAHDATCAAHRVYVAIIGQRPTLFASREEAEAGGRAWLVDHLTAQLAALGQPATPDVRDEELERLRVLASYFVPRFVDGRRTPLRVEEFSFCGQPAYRIVDADGLHLSFASRDRDEAEAMCAALNATAGGEA